MRSESYRADLEAAGAEVRLLDIEQADEAGFAAAFEGAHAVVFAAGGGPDGNIERKRTVDLEGSLKSIAGARAAGITRFVQVSAINVDEPVPDDTEPVWAAYVEAKRDADAALRDSGLDWTIIRPGRLTDDEPTGRVELGERRRPGRGAPRRRRRRARRGRRLRRRHRRPVEPRLRRHPGRRRGRPPGLSPDGPPDVVRRPPAAPETMSGRHRPWARVGDAQRRAGPHRTDPRGTQL